jgi:hypothetical protein
MEEPLHTPFLGRASRCVVGLIGLSLRSQDYDSTSTHGALVSGLKSIQPPARGSLSAHTVINIVSIVTFPTQQ